MDVPAVSFSVLVDPHRAVFGSCRARSMHRRPGSPGRMLEQNVAPGIHRVEDAYTNWYLVEDDSGVTIVDAGVPTSWRSLQEALPQIGKTTAYLKALVLTHA